MEKAEKHKLEKILDSSFKEIRKIYMAGEFREESFCSSLKALAEKCSNFFCFEK